MTEPAYKRFSHCQSCGKTLSEDFAEAHKVLGHKVESYLTVPNLPKYEKKPYEQGVTELEEEENEA